MSFAHVLKEGRAVGVNRELSHEAMGFIRPEGIQREARCEEYHPCFFTYTLRSQRGIPTDMGYDVHAIFKDKLGGRRHPPLATPVVIFKDEIPFVPPSSYGKLADVFIG